MVANLGFGFALEGLEGTWAGGESDSDSEDVSEVLDEELDEEELLEESELESLDVDDTDTSRLRLRDLEADRGVSFNFFDV